MVSWFSSCSVVFFLGRIAKDHPECHSRAHAHRGNIQKKLKKTGEPARVKGYCGNFRVIAIANTRSAAFCRVRGIGRPKMLRNACCWKCFLDLLGTSLFPKFKKLPQPSKPPRPCQPDRGLVSGWVSPAANRTVWPRPRWSFEHVERPGVGGSTR